MEWTEEKSTQLMYTAETVNLKQAKVKQVIELSEDGNTVPFIARYRKEVTGGMDEEDIRKVLDTWNYANQLNTRKDEVIRLISEQDKLTSELEQSIRSAKKLQEVEDLYRPYKQKRRTRGTIAKEKGLEPLAEWLLMLPGSGASLEEATRYIDEEKGVDAAEDALQGAKDIISEMLADDARIRQTARDMTFKDGRMTAKKKPKAEDEKGIFEMYYAYEEGVQKLASHRILALNRGESEGVLQVSVDAPDERIISWIKRQTLKGKQTPVENVLAEAIEDGYKRLIQPAVERDIRREASERAEEQAIHIFAENLQNLLLQPPLKGHTVLGVDPAYRTGCKLAVIDETGKNIEVGVIYPTAPHHKVKEAANEITRLISKHGIGLIAIGNGTASRETEQFVADTVKQIEADVSFMIVNEAGASVYSASKVAKEEFPDLNVEERSAISIARRVQDPLAELVKIDPKSVGVGQYQHDVTQSKLNDSLTFVVETTVNRVGVNVNTASASLLQYVSGLSKSVAGNIVKEREEKGPYTNRKQLKDVPRLGAKTYEQSVGFIRVPGSDELLDETGIHPESYKVTKQLLTKLGLTAGDIGTKAVAEARQVHSPDELAEEFAVGKPTLKDILDALEVPGRDPRDDLPKPLLKTDVLSMEDLTKGMELQGTVRNVVDFGAFVDIGVKQDGLVHVSKLANRFVKNPMDVVAVGDVVTVWVEDADIQKGRIALTMLQPEKQL
ncbi:Tex family protein [Salisediminibacterium halotolerans]|uniref:S1 motif domain-containing protein n=1 Tax=Salisediminibacterium halotolerans TaxID=517425 RepID=A0A1H9SQB4_9BACI|nr:uncharacterized protein SAMN05444126_107104 [Salisediminibacterium haloalkalitolerans]